jgi:F-type H+-transporting ATPase subunit epsilon
MAIALDIVSPERLLLSRSVEMVVIPAAEGDIGALGGHAPMIVALRGGLITLYEDGKPTERLFVAGGFAEITPERCTVLADEAVPPAEVSRSVAQQRLTAAEASYAAQVEKDRDDVVALDEAMARVQSARAMLELAGAP